MVAEALVIGKGYHIFRQTQIGRLWPSRSLLSWGDVEKNENTFRSFTGTPEPTHIWLVGSHMIPFCSLFGMTIQIDTDIFQCSLATR